MHHELRAGAAVVAIEGVGVAGIEGEVVGRVRVHLARRDRVEALGRLAVALALLRPELAGPTADRKALQHGVLPVLSLLPDFELGFFLVEADQDRIAARHALLGHQRNGARRDGCHRLAGRGKLIVAGRKGQGEPHCDQETLHS
jgi:hypothetical protein